MIYYSHENELTRETERKKWVPVWPAIRSSLQLFQSQIRVEKEENIKALAIYVIFFF